MAYQKGTAMGHKDLLAKLRTFALSNGWTSVKWSAPADGEHFLVLKSTGQTGQDSIHLAFETNTLTASDAFNWRVRASAIWIDSTFDAMSEASNQRAVYLWDADIEYYFIVNADHIKVIATVSGTSQYYYGGTFRAFTSRGHWNNPLCCFGVGTDVDARWSSQGDDFSAWQFVRGSNATQVQNRLGDWKKMTYLWPCMDTRITTQSLPRTDNIVSILQVLMRIEGENIVGELYGCYGLSGFGLSHGQVVQQNGRSFLVVQNVYRAGQGDYLAMELI
ncbi:hypothetical protein [Vibrio phage vB_VhaS-tm]|nr:hypothetical protein [Vibrio phage vB_VhaS-tm]